MRSKTLFYLHPLTVLIIVFSFVTNTFTYVLMHYLLTLIHELGHVITAKVMKIDVKEICLLPFGFYAEIDRLEQNSFMKQVIVILDGLLMIIPSILLLKILYYNSLISIFMYEYGIKMSMTIFLFNLIPFYPLDGGRILDNLIAIYFSERKTRVIRIIINITAFIFISLLCFRCNQYLLLFFLLLVLLKQIKNIKIDYWLFLCLRLIRKNTFKKKINKVFCLYRFRNNFTQIDSREYQEKEVIEKIMKI